MNRIINYTVIDQMKMVYVKHYYKIKVIIFKFYFLVTKGRIIIKHQDYYDESKEINESYTLSTT